MGMPRPRKNPDEPQRHPPQPLLVPIGRRLQQARKLIPGKPSQEVAGSAVGVTGAAWSQWERGIWPVHVQALLWVADRSRVTVEWIVTGSAAAVLPKEVAKELLPRPEYLALYPEPVQLQQVRR